MTKALCVKFFSTKRAWNFDCQPILNPSIYPESVEITPNTSANLFASQIMFWWLFCHRWVLDLGGLITNLKIEPSVLSRESRRVDLVTRSAERRMSQHSSLSKRWDKLKICDAGGKSCYTKIHEKLPEFSFPYCLKIYFTFSARKEFFCCLPLSFGVVNKTRHWTDVGLSF